MLKPESLPHFYQHYFQGMPPQEAEQVNVFRLEEVRVPSIKLIAYKYPVTISLLLERLILH